MLFTRKNVKLQHMQGGQEKREEKNKIYPAGTNERKWN